MSEKEESQVFHLLANGAPTCRYSDFLKLHVGCFGEKLALEEWIRLAKLGGRTDTFEIREGPCPFSAKALKWY